MGNPCPLARITATLVVQKYYIAAHLPSLERESFPPFRCPMVDNFPPLPRNKLTFSSAPKIQKSVCVVKHLFAPFAYLDTRAWLSRSQGGEDWHVTPHIAHYNTHGSTPQGAPVWFIWEGGFFTRGDSRGDGVAKEEAKTKTLPPTKMWIHYIPQR